MSVSDAQRLKTLESMIMKLKKLLANSRLEIDAMREVLGRNSGHVGASRSGQAIAGDGTQ